MKEKIEKLIQFIQKILINILLFLVYCFLIGGTWIIARIFKPSLLKNKPINDETFWIKAEGYNADFKDCLKQS